MPDAVLRNASSGGCSPSAASSASTPTRFELVAYDEPRARDLSGALRDRGDRAAARYRPRPPRHGGARRSVKGSRSSACPALISAPGGVRPGSGAARRWSWSSRVAHDRLQHPSVSFARMRFRRVPDGAAPASSVGDMRSGRSATRGSTTAHGPPMPLGSERPPAAADAGPSLPAKTDARAFCNLIGRRTGAHATGGGRGPDSSGAGDSGRGHWRGSRWAASASRPSRH